MEGDNMMTAMVFENGRSQAIRLPKAYRFDEKEVAVHKVGDVLMVMPKEKSWDGLLASLDLFSDDFMAEERNQDELQERESL